MTSFPGFHELPETSLGRVGTLAGSMFLQNTRMALRLTNVTYRYA